MRRAIIIFAIYIVQEISCSVIKDSGAVQVMVKDGDGDYKKLCHSLKDPIKRNEADRELNALKSMIDTSKVDLPSLDTDNCNAGKVNYKDEVTPDSKCSVINCSPNPAEGGFQYDKTILSNFICSSRQYFFLCYPSKPNLVSNGEIIHLMYRATNDEVVHKEGKILTKRSETLVSPCIRPI